MKTYKSILYPLLLVAFVMLIGVGITRGGESASSKTELYILAAASLTDVLNEIEQQYEKTHKDIDLIMIYASSGKLQKQIEQGAPADLFISAGVKQMEELKEKQLIKLSKPLLKNELVLITSKDITLRGIGSNQVTHIAIGNPDTVPAGEYAKQLLQELNLWDQVESKLILANDVRQILTYVETENVDAGFVYKTDIERNSNIKNLISLDIPIQIFYPMGIVKKSRNITDVQAFFDWIQKEEAMQIFTTYGFKMYN